MRVGLDGYPLCESLTGVGHYTLELARALALNHPADEFQLIAPSDFHSSVVAQLEQNRIPNLSLISRGLKSVRGRWWSFHLPRYLKRAGLDLFHGTNYELPLWNSRHTVLTVHDLSSLLYPELHRRQLARRMRLRLPLAVKLARAIITPTEAVKQELCARFRLQPAKVTAIHEAPRASFNPAPPDECLRVRDRLGIEEEFLLFVGTLEPRKNLVTLLRAYAQIVRETPWRPQLVIAGGEGWSMDETFAMLREETIAERVRFSGYLDDHELRALYSSCRAFIYPSLYEGFGLPPLEAMACGAPVIAGRIGALQETIADAAVLVPALDVPALAAAIVDLLANKSRRDELRAAGLARAATFSWTKAAELTWEVYESAL
ncbi:MAG TPA: glycosyltransferase family 1 protein [Pyrinomonadaceae bacterium]|jgi:glycosyltransferase involved in cell wall biosynthesis|nr:glycosyltransferase family 1 protein [Pyrinomonadaceae bacterium]